MIDILLYMLVSLLLYILTLIIYNYIYTMSGISQACSGVKPDCYGFQWHFYDGPYPIDCKLHIQNKHTNLLTALICGVAVCV